MGRIGLSYNDLTGWDFSGQDLIGADLYFSTLTNANLAGATVAGARFGDYVGLYWVGFTKEQLYSTASYQQRNLRGIGLRGQNLNGWDFSGQDLTGANFGSSTLRNANFSFADLRGAFMDSGPIQLARNSIREFGAINGLDLQAEETLMIEQRLFCNLLFDWCGSVGFHSEIGPVRFPVFADFHEDSGLCRGASANLS